MKLKKMTCGLLVIIFSLFLVACSSSKTSNLQETIKKRQKLIVAVSPDYPPFEFKAFVNGKDKVVGADIDLAQAIADELGVKLEISTMSFDNVLASLKNRKADIAISGLSVTADRRNAYDFSESYYTDENAILVRKNDIDKYTSLDKLAGKKVAVQKGTIEEHLSKKQLKDSQIVSLTAMGEAINELKSGVVDAVDLEKPVAQGYIEQNKDIALSHMALKTGEEDAKAVALPKGKSSDELKETINKVIAKMKKNNQYDIYISNAAKLTSSAEK